jgi:hypothetical protein
MTASIASLTAVARLLSPASPITTSATPMQSWSAIQGNVLSAVSAKLGMSQSDLTAALKTGKSMTAVASAAGVSASDLTATIQSVLVESNLPVGVGLGTMAHRMADNVNNSFIADSPTTAATARTTSAAGLGIDTSAVSSVRVGSLSLSSDEVSMLLGTSTPHLDTYL